MANTLFADNFKYVHPISHVMSTIDIPVGKNGTMALTNQFQKFTQAEYDAIATKDENTVYFIIEE